MTEHVSAFDAILNAAPLAKVNGVRVVSPMRPHADDQSEEESMPTGIYERKPRGEPTATPKKRGRKPKTDAAPPVAKTPRGQYSAVLADLRAQRDSIDVAIKAIEALA